MGEPSTDATTATTTKNKHSKHHQHHEEDEKKIKTKQQQQDENGELVKVYLRLRPMNKLEASKRSKDCIELHDDPKIVTVDSPLQGLFDFQFEMVFDEYASQEEVYKESLSGIPEKLLKGINCAVMAYGQTGTGKSHTMLGYGGEATARARSNNGSSSSSNSSNSSHKADKQQQESPPKLNPELSQDLDITEGMIPRVVRDIFQQIQTTVPPSVEVTVRCSYVEIYLEKIKDLLQPSRKGIRVGGGGDDGEFCLLGATELCCLSPHDVYTILARGSSFRSATATGHNTESRRSHCVFTLQIIQMDHDTGKYKQSRLYMLDMAGSETGRTKSSRQVDTPGAMEARMVSASLQSVFTYIRAKLVEQGKDKSRIHPNAYANVSKLSKLLKPCFGGNYSTTILCTASPSSYNIDETIGTIKFGQKVRLLKNFPTPCHEMTMKEMRSKLLQSEKRAVYLTRFLKVVSQECRILRKTGKVRHQPHSNRIWDAISKIAKSGSSNGDDDDGSDLFIQISSDKNHSRQEKSIDDENDKDDGEANKAFEAKLKEHKLAREKAENAMRDFQSEVYTLKSQLEVMTKDKQRLERELNDAKDEIATSTNRKNDLEQKLRTSRYRENEAVVFLRQFRSFYVRLLKSKASQGNGPTAKVIDDAMAKVPGAPTTLAKMLDIDKLMVESGLIEKEEVGEDSNKPGYSPSNDATAASAEQAEKAEDREMYLIQEMTGASESVLRALEPGQLTSYRQKLLTTPAGKLAMKQERELEREILELSHKVVNLQNSVNAEKAMVEALSARQGALGKMKTAQEMNVLKTEVERKTNDLQAIVWKMNELHLVNKTIDEKLENRDSHISFLEDRLAELQTKSRRLEETQHEGEKKLREETLTLKQQLDGITLKLWQLGETTPELSNIWRFIVPCTGEPVDLSSSGRSRHERRSSVGTLAEEAISLLENPERPHRTSASTQTETTATTATTTDSGTQTEKATMEDSETQTNTATTAEISIQTDGPSRLHSVAVEISTQTDAAETTSVEVQTEIAETAEIEVQTDEPYPEISKKLERAEIEVQTDEAVRMHTEVAEIETQTDGDFKLVVEGKEIAIQTDEEETKTAPTVSEISTQTEAEPGPTVEVKQQPIPETTEISTQTEAERTKIRTEAATQTDGLPNEIALVKAESSASLELTQHDSKHDVDPSSMHRGEQRRPPKPVRSFDSTHSSKYTEGGDQEDLDESLQLLHNSASSIGSFGPPSLPDGSSHDNSTTKRSSQTTQLDIHSRMGASMSAIHGHTHTTVDWRARMKLQGKETAATPQPVTKEKIGSKHSIPRPPLSHAGMMSQPVLSHTPSPRNRKFKKKDDSTPEWLSKFKEMGIKGDENEDNDAVGTPSSASGRYNRPKVTSRKPSKPKSMANVNFGSSTPKALPKTAVADPPEWMSKFKAMGIKADENDPDPEPEPEEVVTPPPEAEDDPSEPEWKKQFKKIGMKGEEVIVEGPPPPEKKAVPPPPKPKTPEWMLKFKEMGIDGGEAK